MGRIKYIAAMAALVAAAVTGCKGGDSANGASGINIYCLDGDGTKLKTFKYDIEAEELCDKVDELFNELKTQKKGCVSAIPENLSMTYKISGNMLELNFDVSYSNMTGVEEIFARASLVLTYVQLEEIDYVSVFVNNNPLTDAVGSPVGMMSGEDFIYKVGSTINNYKNTTVTLYFANVGGNKLRTEIRSGMYDSSEPLEKYVVMQLIKGASQDGGYRTIPQDTKILSINTNNGICYIDFSSEFSKGASSVKDEVMVYSIVNSLTELQHINKVQISVEGEIDVELHGRLSLNQVFVKDLSLMEK